MRGGKPYPSNTLAAIFGALLGSRGILTLIIFSTLGESSLRVYWRNLRSRARDVGMFKAFCENERALADAYRAKRKASRAASASTAVLFQSTAPASVYTERSDSVRSDTEGDVTDEDDDNGLEPNVNRWLREEIELFTQAYAAHAVFPPPTHPLQGVGSDPLAPFPPQRHRAPGRRLPRQRPARPLPAVGQGHHARRRSRDRRCVAMRRCGMLSDA